MSDKSIYFKLGKRIGYWYAANRHNLHKQLLSGLIHRLPGGRWITKFF